MVVEPQPSKRRATVTLLDAAIILTLAFTSAMLVVWLAGVVRDKEFFASGAPPVFRQMASSVWTWLTGGASSVLLTFLRRSLNRNVPQPNYLLWTAVTAVGILVFVGAVSQLLPSAPPAPSPLDASVFDLQFQVRNSTSQMVAFLQRKPSQHEPENIALQANGQFLVKGLELPSHCSAFEAIVLPVITTSVQADTTVTPATMKFLRGSKDPSPPVKAVAECRIGANCLLSVLDPGWLKSSDDGCVRLTRIVDGFVPTVYAQAPTPQSDSGRGWNTPSLQTLAAMKDRRSIGYTKFVIDGPSIGALGNPDTFTYLISVNGTSIHVDGAPEQDMTLPVRGASFTFPFGLENLDFAGGATGCERLEVALTFRHAGQVVRAISMSREYAALRNAPAKSIIVDGLPFRWQGEYVEPKSEDTNEVFITSSQRPEALLRAKTKVDNEQRQFEGSAIVGVLRPPLQNSSYGLVLGLRKPNGQIRFTFDIETAKRLWNTARALRSSSAVFASIVHESAYVGNPTHSHSAPLGNACSG
jgi:hypothetical protein